MVSSGGAVVSRWWQGSVVPIAVALFGLAGCDVPGPEGASDLPGPAAGQLDGVSPVPETLLPLDGHQVQRVAVGQGGERIYGSIRESESGQVLLVDWRWNADAERWDGPSPLSFAEAGLPDEEIALAPDGSYLLFTSARPTDQIGAADYNVWLSRWEEGIEPDESGEWSDPWLLPTVHSPAWDGTPALAMSGNLYFSSERDADTPGRDLYVARLDGGMWGAPQRLPEPVNSEGHEVDPWVAPDESFLLFSSNREGNWDLYISFANEAGEWGAPDRLGGDVTSDGDERAPVLTLGGEVLFFVRGDGQLWWAPSGAAGVVRPDGDVMGD